MKIIKYSQSYNRPISLALGFFDSLHVGHQALIDKAKREDLELAVFTFGQNLYAGISTPQPLVLTFEERLERLERRGVEVVVEATPSEEFLSTKPIDFLNVLTNTLNICHITVGTDYTYGAGGLGDVETLSAFCESRDIPLTIVDLMNIGEHKIGTRYIRSALIRGDVEEANTMLGYRYYLSGEVVSGDMVGRTLGYPTANIKVNDDKVILGLGVYATFVEVDGVQYKGMTAISNRPTFLSQKVTIETYILDFQQDLYGKTITLTFVKKIRDNYKFSSTNDLVDRLREDERIVRELNYD